MLELGVLYCSDGSGRAAVAARRVVHAWAGGDGGGARMSAAARCGGGRAETAAARPGCGGARGGGGSGARNALNPHTTPS